MGSHFPDCVLEIQNVFRDNKSELSLVTGWAIFASLFFFLPGSPMYYVLERIQSLKKKKR